LNNYRNPLGWNIGDDGNNYQVDGIDDKLKTTEVNDSGTSFPLFKLRSTCIDDDSSEWLASFGDVNRYDFKTSRPIQQNGFVHTGEGFATNCANTNGCTGAYTDVAGQRAMGYYDEGFLNYYYYMAAQFAVSDRWFSPLASKSTPNRIAMFSGGTTQGLIRDPGYDDHLGALPLPSIFQALDNAGVSWKLYYTQTVGGCLDGDDCAPGTANEPGTTFGYINYYHKYEYINPTHAACTPPTQPSSVVGDTKDSFCIDPNHIAKLSTYFSDVASGNLASFSFIESGSATDEHPASWQNVLGGQVEVASIINAFMASPSWNDSVFFFSYDEGGGPYDHVPPVPGHSNDFTDASLLAATTIPDIASIVVNPDSYFPCLPSTSPATQHCDLEAGYPGTSPGDAATVHGFAAQIGFRLPNIVISPFTRRHYVSHIPMDHTAVIKFVENRFIGPNAHLTARDAVQPDLLDFFDFNNVPWAAPPTPPNPVTSQTLGYSPCTPAALGP
jgi:phospholipase C